MPSIHRHAGVSPAAGRTGFWPLQRCLQRVHCCAVMECSPRKDVCGVGSISRTGTMGSRFPGSGVYSNLKLPENAE